MTIEERRAEIDRIDAELLRIVSLRAQVACEVFALKRANGEPVCDPQRELQVVQRAQHSNTGPLDNLAVARIFRAVIEESRQLERRLECQFLERQLELQLEPQLEAHIRESHPKDTLATKQETTHDR